jgi:ATP-dependent DNA helicase RecG
MTTPEEFRVLIESPESTRVEFKAASGGFHFEALAKYCVALANEGGGKIVLGVTDRRPRSVVGTRAFSEPGRTEAGLFERLGHQIAVEEYRHEGNRVLIVHVPSRLQGTAWDDRGTYWMRSGDALVPMSDERLRWIHAETGPDFSAEICPEARLLDLDPAAIGLLRQLW